MGHNDYSNGRLHQPLDMPTVEQLAAHATQPLSQELVEATADAVRRLNDTNPYWVHAEVQQDHPEVAIGDVAAALLHLAG